VGTRLEPLEWQRLAEETAVRLRADIEAFRAEYRPLPAGVSFSAFWLRARKLNEEMRTAPAIKLDDKLGLQSALNELCEYVVLEQQRVKEEVARSRQEISETLALARETIDQANRADEIQAARSDLAALRERITGPDSPLDGRERRAVWQEWHTANQLAWARLNDFWQANEASLSALLDQAKTAIDSGRSRDARDRIRDFHAAIPSQECSHRSLRSLQSRAGRLWEEADEVARQKHEVYMANAGIRLGRWKAELHENERTRVTLIGEIQEIEQRREDASTDIAVALYRGQLAALARQLDRLEDADRLLQLRIGEAESAVSES